MSVRDCKTRRVIAHVESITLKDCLFKVSEKGRQRVLRERQKNVHAGVEGEWVADTKVPPGNRIIYDPYRFSSFVSEITGQPYKQAPLALITPAGAFIGPETSQST